MQKQVLQGSLGVGIGVKTAGVGALLNKPAAPMAANAAVSNVHMSMHQIQDPLEVSASAVDQLVQIELDNLAEEFEEQKIQHERIKREELKNMEQDKRNMKLKLQTDAERDLDVLRNRLEAER